MTRLADPAHSGALTRSDYATLLFLAVLSGALFCFGLGSYSVVNGDEGFYHAVARNMLASGNWFRIEFTGEHRIYGRNAGAFGRVVPLNPVNGEDGNLGALQVAARVSYLDLNDGDIRGGQQLNTTFALNWYLTRNLRLGFNYIYGHVMGQGDVNVLQVRFQLHL